MASVLFIHTVVLFLFTDWLLLRGKHLGSDVINGLLFDYSFTEAPLTHQFKVGQLSIRSCEGCSLDAGSVIRLLVCLQ